MNIGDTVYLKAARRFCGWNGRYRDEPRRGPFTVRRIYTCGDHTRVTANTPSHAQIDTSITQLET